MLMFDGFLGIWCIILLKVDIDIFKCSYKFFWISWKGFSGKRFSDYSIILDLVKTTGGLK